MFDYKKLGGSVERDMGSTCWVLKLRGQTICTSHSSSEEIKPMVDEMVCESVRAIRALELAQFDRSRVHASQAAAYFGDREMLSILQNSENAHFLMHDRDCRAAVAIQKALSPEEIAAIEQEIAVRDARNAKSLTGESDGDLNQHQGDEDTGSNAGGYVGLKRVLNRFFHRKTNSPEREPPEILSTAEITFPSGSTIARLTRQFNKLKTLAEQGDVSAQYQLGMRYKDGIGVTKDDKLAAAAFLAAAEQGHATAQSRLGDMYMHGHGVVQDGAEASYWIYTSTAQRDESARCNGSGAHVPGIDVASDPPHDELHNHEAAEGCDSAAQYELGKRYLSGDGVARDEALAVRWLLASARQGHVEAQSKLATLYDGGRGVPKDGKKAAFWYGEAAKKGNEWAQYRLGVMHLTGDGVPRDVCKAANSFYLNAVAGNAASLCNLGAMYAAGLGLPRNEKQAAISYGEAALHGDATAQVNLGAMYRDGDVLVKDERYAVLLFRTAAVRGYADAKFNFGRMLIAGRGCDADTYLGRQWLHMAAEQGHRGAARELEKIGDIGE